MAINFGEALLSFIGGAAPGYVRGRQDLLERRREQEKEAKEEQRRAEILEKEQEQKNQQLAGRQEAFGLLTAVSGISPQTPASEIFKIKSQYLDAADRAGLDLKTANVLFDDAAQMEARQPVSPLDIAKLETEREQTKAATALAEQRKAGAEASKARAENYRQQAKKLADSGTDLVSTINAITRLQDNLRDDLGEVPEENQELFDDYQAQIDALIAENAKRKKVPPLLKPPEPEPERGRIKVDY